MFIGAFYPGWSAGSGGLAPTLWLRGDVVLGADASQQHTCRLVVRILRHQLATERLGEDALGQRIDALFGGGEFGFELIGESEELLDAAADFRFVRSASGAAPLALLKCGEHRPASSSAPRSRATRGSRKEVTTIARKRPQKTPQPWRGL